MSRYVSESIQTPVIDTGGNPRAPFFNRCVYDTPGTYCFTVPSGVCTIRVVTVGAGGPSCRRVGPTEEYLRSLTCGGEPDQIFCGHDGFYYKMITCIRPVSSCADYCNCAACGTIITRSCSYACNLGTNVCQSVGNTVCLQWTPGVAGAGTTIYVESCYMSGQSIVGPSGGYADGCLSVTPGCSFTVTVGCAGGSSGFGTFISATGGSVAITQRPKVRCHYASNACYLICGTDAVGTTPISIASSTPTSNCTVYLSNSTHCYVHRYENCCALATLTAGVGTAWSGMCNVIVRSGAAGTIFHPSEYSFGGCLTGPTGFTGSTPLSPCSSQQGFTQCYVVNVSIANTANNCYCVQVSRNCMSFGYGMYCDTCFIPTLTCTQEHRVISRCWGGASAGNYFNNGINQSDFNIFKTLCSGCCCHFLNGCLVCLFQTTLCTHSYNAGPLLPCCTTTLNCWRINAFSDCFCSDIQVRVSRPVDQITFGAAGGSGIRSPGTPCLGGSGNACCTCALNCAIGSFAYCYFQTDNVNGIFCVLRSYPPACNCGMICCAIVPSNITGSSYWYPEDMRGHSNMSYCFGGGGYCVCTQPGAGSAPIACCLNQPGIMGGSNVCYWSSGVPACSLCQNVCISSCCTLCAGGTFGFADTCITNGGCCGLTCDSRCISNTRGMVIVYF